MDNQTLHKSPGVTTFGSWTVSAEVDIVIMELGIDVFEITAKKAFSNLKKQSKSVRKTFGKFKDADVNTSHVRLFENHNTGNRADEGYRASISFKVKLSSIDKMEQVITSAIEAGANRILSVTFHSSELRKHRAEARRLAVIAAREKAAVYCDAAGVKLGEVLNIEDLNPDKLETRGYGNSSIGWMSGGGENEGSMNPSDLQITGAVRVTYSLAET